MGAPVGLAGTFETMAPVVLQERNLTTAVDIWSAGAVLFHLVCGQPLLPDAAQDTALDLIAGCCPLPATARPSHVSEACWDLLQWMLEVDVQRRLTAAQVLEHPWLCLDTATCNAAEAKNQQQLPQQSQQQQEQQTQPQRQPRLQSAAGLVRSTRAAGA